MEATEYLGKTFHHLTITADAPRMTGQAAVLCDCLKCGRTGVPIRRYHVLSGMTKTCGCGQAAQRSRFARAGWQRRKVLGAGPVVPILSAERDHGVSDRCPGG